MNHIINSSSTRSIPTANSNTLTDSNNHKSDREKAVHLPCSTESTVPSTVSTPGIAGKPVRNSQRKRLIGNFVSLYAIQVAGVVLPLITIPHVTRAIGLDNFGIIVFARSLITYFSSICDYGFNLTATRDIATAKNDSSKISKIYSNAVTIKLSLAVLSIAVVTIVSQYIAPSETAVTMFWVMSLCILGDALLPTWYFQGVERMYYLAATKLASQIAATALIFWVIRSPQDGATYACILAGSTILSGTIGQLLAIRDGGLRYRVPALRQITKELKSGFPIFVNQAIPLLYNNTTIFLTGLLTSPASTGTFGLMKSCVEAGTAVMQTASRVCFPYLTKNKSGFDAFKKNMAVASVVLVGALLAATPVVFWMLNRAITPYLFTTYAVLALGIIGVSGYHVFGVNYLIANRYDRTVVKNTTTASLIAFVTAVPAIMTFGILGAAMNVTFARLLMGGGVYAIYFSMSKKHRRNIQL